MTDGRITKATAGLSILLVALTLLAVAPAHVNHDAAWYLYTAQRWLRGAALYRDVIDTNPPLIIWISAVPVWIASLGGWPATAVFKIFVFTGASLSLLTVRWIVTKGWPSQEFLLVSSVVFVSLPFAKGDFGQREHFAVLLILPYVFLAIAEPDVARGPSRRLLGGSAGLGFAIKPHFLAVWLAIEAVAFRLRGRRTFRRAELQGAVAAFIAYGTAVFLFTPEYFRVADQVRQVYGGLDSPFAVLLRLREVQLWLAALALFLAVRWPASDRLPVVMFATATGYLIAAVAQLKGWGYQLYPARVFLILFLVVAAGTVLNAVPSFVSLLRGGRRGLASVFAGALVVASVRYAAEARRPTALDLVSPMIEAIEKYAPAGPLAVLSMRTIISPAFPAVNYSGASWSLRHNSLWFLPGLYRDQDRNAGGPLQPHAVDAMPALEALFFDEIVNDLCASPPALLAIEQALPAAPAGRRALDLLAYYGQSPRAKRLLESYRAQGSLGPFTLLTPTTGPSCQ